MAANKLVLFESLDKSISLNVPLRNDSVWLNRNQMAELFDRDVKTIGKHVNNAIREELDGLPVDAKFATTAADGKTYMVDYYELDVIISVGYRVKSQRGVEFRKWANSVLSFFDIYQKRKFAFTRLKTKNPQSISPVRRGILWGFSMPYSPDREMFRHHVQRYTR